jgi:hypothetical protein
MTATTLGHKQIQAELQSTVAFIGNTGRRAFDAVVFELADGNCNALRTVVVKTSGTQHPAIDRIRVQRTARRLKSMGYRVNWSSFGHPQDGVKGAVRMFRTTP